MQRMDAGGTLASRPSPNATSSPGWANNDPSGSSPPTIFDPDWANGIEAELEAIITAGGGAALSKTTTNQVLTAIQALIGTSSALAGQARNLKAYLASAGSSVTFGADEVVVETALGGTAYKLANYSQTLNIGTTGAGGMDTGSAPASGFLAVYAIYNPATQTQSILGVNAATSSGTIYSGGHMPSGYTASGLIAILPTNSTPAIEPGSVIDRTFFYVSANFPSVFSGATGSTTYTEVSLSGIVPATARKVSFLAGVTSGTAGNSGQMEIAGDSLGTGVRHESCYIGAAAIGGYQGGDSFRDVPMVLSSPQIWWRAQFSSSNYACNVIDYTW